jgi:serine/threonine-protein kinase HipA
LRNHGFLWSGTAGWRLSPAYDLNPMPLDIRPRILTTAISLDDATASLDLAFEVADYFDLAPREARQIVSEVGRCVSGWRRVATKLGIAPGEVDRMSSAFDHQDLKSAVAARHVRNKGMKYL